MDTVVQTLGVAAIVLLVLIGLVAGWIAAKVAGGHTARYMVIGAVAAVATPFVAAALGLAALAASGLIALLGIALIGAVIVLVIAKLVFD